MKRKDAQQTVSSLIKDVDLHINLLADRLNFYKWVQSNGIEDCYIAWLNLGVDPNDHDGFRDWWSASVLRGED